MQGYWSRVIREEFVQLLNLQTPRETIPIAWHVDGVKIYRNQKAWVYSYSSLLKKKHDSLTNKMIFMLVRDHLLIKGKTHERIGKLIGYAMRTLESGNYPLHDCDGNDFPPNSKQAYLAGKPFSEEHWKCCFAAFKSDLEARVHIHRLTRNYMANYICEHCIAGKVNFCYKDFTANASWQDMRFTHEQFLALNSESKQSPWITVPGWTKDRNLEDLLHTLHLGVSCCAIAGLLKDHLVCKHPGLTLDALDRGVGAAFNHYRKWCRANRVPSTSLRFNARRFGMVAWGALPELSSQYKANTVKYMQFWIHAYLMDEGELERSRDRQNVSYALSKFQWMIDMNGPWFSKRDAALTADYGFCFLLFY